MKLKEEDLKELCNKQNVEYIGVISKKEKSSKSTRFIQFICPEHREFGVQERKIYDFQRLNKICKYCNHSNLADVFQEEVSKVNQDIIVVSNYKNWNTKVRCECNKCGNTWEARPSVILYGGGCPKCGRQRANLSEMISQEEIEHRIYEANPDIIVIGKYNGGHKNIRCKCKIDGTEWESTPYRLIDKTCRCPECVKNELHQKFALSNDDFLARVKSNNLDIDVIGKYYSARTPIKCRCKIHNIEYETLPINILYNSSSGCPLCTQSSGERLMFKILSDNGYKTIQQYTFDDCVYINRLRFDAYLPHDNIAIEFQGGQHYFPVDFSGQGKEYAIKQFELNLKRDRIKEEYCRNNNIPLIKIPYWEYDNMECFLLSEMNRIKENTNNTC